VIGTLELIETTIRDLDPDGTIRAKLKAGDVKPASPAASPDQPEPDGLPPFARRVARARRYLARIEPAIQGSGGSNPTFYAARVLIHGYCLDANTALGLLLAEYNPRCEPPWSVKELEHKVQQAESKPFNKPRGWVFEEKASKPASGPPAADCIVPNNSDSPPASAAEPELNEAIDDPHRLSRAVLSGYRSGKLRTLAYWQGEFHQWDGRRYQTVPEKEFRPTVNRVVRRELEAVHRAALEAYQPSEDTKPPQMPKVPDALVSNVLAALAGEVLVKNVEAPAWIAVEGPDPREVVAARNGLVHLPAFAAGHASAVIENTPKYLNFNAVGFDADAAAPAPVEWLAFLRALWPDDSESIALLQEWFGYLLVPDNRMQKMLLMIGPPRSGKGTIARVLQELVGPDNVGNPTLGSLGGDFGLETLVGKSVAVIEDARLSRRTDSAMVAERLLTISGGGRLDINRKHKAHFTGRLTTRFVVATNELPDLSDASGALANRWCLLRLTRSFLGREDETLVDRLLTELPGIFNWAVEGWKRLREQRRFSVPSASKDLVEDMHDIGSPVGEFVKERCLVGDNHIVEIAQIYEDWRKWCEAKGKKEPGTSNQFGRHLRAYVHSITRKRPRRDGKQIECYAGITLKPFDFDDRLDDRLPFERDERDERDAERDAERDEMRTQVSCQPATCDFERDERDDCQLNAYGEVKGIPNSEVDAIANHHAHHAHVSQPPRPQFGEGEL
jgi:putative DNA primase/helicase